jgi:hypothetical protein
MRRSRRSADWDEAALDESMSSSPAPAAPATAPAIAPLTASPHPKRRWKRAVITAIKLTLFITVLLFVTHTLIAQFQKVDWDNLHFRFVPAALSVLCMIGVSAVQLVMFRTLLSAYGYRLPWRVTVGLAWVPPLGKYVPGKVAAIAGAVHLQRQHGIPGAVAVSVAVMLDGLAVIAGLVVAAPLLVWHEQLRQRYPTAWIWCAILALVGVSVLHPRVFVGLLNVMLHRLKRQPLKVVPSLGRFIIPVVAAFGQWIFAGLGLWLMTRSVKPDITTQLIPLFISTAALAMTFSYLALFAAGGLGVREALYLIALGGPIVGVPAALVVVAMCVVQTLLEVTLAAIGWLSMRSHRHTPPPPNTPATAAVVMPSHLQVSAARTQKHEA